MPVISPERKGNGAMAISRMTLSITTIIIMDLVATIIII